MYIFTYTHILPTEYLDTLTHNWNYDMYAYILGYMSQNALKILAKKDIFIKL